MHVKRPSRGDLLRGDLRLVEETYSKEHVKITPRRLSLLQASMQALLRP
jgi:hypothetical protein